MENPPKKFFRLSPGTEVRLRYAYFIKCTDVVKNVAGEVTELRCTYDPATKGGNAPTGARVKATMHWLSVAHSVPAEIRIYNQLFLNPAPDAANFAADINPQSLEILPDARIEPAIAQANSSEAMQFERQGYFVRDVDSTPERPVFNRTIGLRDTLCEGSRRQGVEQVAAQSSRGLVSPMPASVLRSDCRARLSLGLFVDQDVDEGEPLRLVVRFSEQFAIAGRS